MQYTMLPSLVVLENSNNVTWINDVSLIEEIPLPRIIIPRYMIMVIELSFR